MHARTHAHTHARKHARTPTPRTHARAHAHTPSGPAPPRLAGQVGAEAALVRPQFYSGTHTIACALYGTLRPGDELLALAGHPYDTLEEARRPKERVPT